MSKPPPSLSLWSSSPSQTPRICSIAGSDSGGGAGIQADLKTILALGGYGLSVVTALTAQNTTGVSGIHVPPADFLRQQMRSVRSDIRVDAWKVGMLANAEVVQTVAEELNRGNVEDAPRAPHAPVVLDPVMVSTSGSLLLPHEAIQTLIKKLLPTCALLTPNLPEAEQLLAHATQPQDNGAGSSSSSKQPLQPPQSLKTLQDRLEAAKKLADLGPRAVLLKGGHQAIKRREVDEALRKLGVDGSGDRKRCDEIRLDLFGDKGMPIGALDAGAEIQVSSTSSSSSSSSPHDLIVIRSDGYPYSPVLRSIINPTSTSTEDESVVIDVLYTTSTNTYTLFINPSLPHSCTHGTGCTLSSALATHLGASTSDVGTEDGAAAAAEREDAALRRACWRSIAYVQAAIVRGYEDLGKGPGALDHAVSVAPRGLLASTAERVARGDVDVDDAGGGEGGEEKKGDVMERYATMLSSSPAKSRPLGAQPLPLITSLLSRSRASWEGYVWHEFVQRFGLHFRPTAATTSTNSGTTTSSSSSKPLPLGSFLHFLKQDYHFLLHYSRLWSLSASSASSFSEAQYFLSLAAGMAAEASGHVALCSNPAFGVTKRELEETKEEGAVMAYTRFVLDVAHKEGAAGLETLVVTMPCLLGYADMGDRLRQADRDFNGGKDVAVEAHPTTLPASLRTWYRQYTSPEYLTAVRAGLVKMESLAAGLAGGLGGERMEKLQGLWDMAVRLERGMWDEALRVGEERQG